MNISEVNITPVKPRDGLVAFCTFVINNEFFVGDVAIYTRLGAELGGYRLSYPTRTLPNNTKIECFHPITKEAGEFIERVVSEEYERLTEQQ